MSEKHKARLFKSGNSLALRLPKKLGLSEGENVEIVAHADGSFTFWREKDAGAILDGLYGAFSPGFMRDGRGDIEQDERDWSVSVRDEAA